MYTRGLQIKQRIGQNCGHFRVVICKRKRKTILWPPCIRNCGLFLALINSFCTFLVPFALVCQREKAVVEGLQGFCSQGGFRLFSKKEGPGL